MSLLGWFSRRRIAPPESSGLSRIDATRPLRTGVETMHGGAAARITPPAEPATRRTERLEQRERLYSVVRESMVRSGVLSSGYKFKVLALDALGRQFMVMMDLSREFGRDAGRLSEIEVLIAQGAKQRFDILVTAVYWRLSDHVAVGQPQMRPVVGNAGTTSAPGASSAAVAQIAPAGTPPLQAPLSAAEAAVAAIPTLGAAPNSVPMPTARRAVPAAPTAPVAPIVPGSKIGARFEPIQADEIEAFKMALAASVTTAKEAGAGAVETTSAAQFQADKARRESTQRKAFAWPKRNPPRLTGYEDTEAIDPQERNPGLSETQYGDLH